MSDSIVLKVAMARSQSEAGYGRARMDSESRRALGLELGDTMSIQVQVPIRENTYTLVIDLMVVGAYDGGGSQKEIYVPLSFWCDPSWITGEEAPMADGERLTTSSSFSDKAGRDAYFYISTNFSTCRFTLASPRQLDDLRDYLEKHHPESRFWVLPQIDLPR